MSPEPDALFPKQAEALAVPHARRGVVVADVAAADDVVRVVIPSFHPRLVHEVDWWMPRFPSFPKKEDECLIILDEEHSPWMVTYWRPGANYGSGDMAAGGDLTGFYPDPEIDLTADGGLARTGSIGIDLDTNPGLALGSGGIKLLLDSTPGLVLGAGGLSALLKSGGGLAKDADGIYTTAGSGPGYGTSLPGSPADGDEYYYVADATNKTVWHLRYNASGGTYKWELIGGGFLRSAVATDQNTTSVSTWVDLTTAGPDVTVPLAGDYVIMFGARSYSGTSSSRLNVGVAATGGTPVAGMIAGAVAHTNATDAVNMVGRSRETGISAAAVRRLRYRGSAASTNFLERWIAIEPVRVTG